MLSGAHLKPECGNESCLLTMFSHNAISGIQSSHLLIYFQFDQSTQYFKDVGQWLSVIIQLNWGWVISGLWHNNHRCQWIYMYESSWSIFSEEAVISVESLRHLVLPSWYTHVYQDCKELLTLMTTKYYYYTCWLMTLLKYCCRQDIRYHWKLWMYTSYCPHSIIHHWPSQPLSAIHRLLSTVCHV